jgi:AcrR family transcriptional regulator
MAARKAPEATKSPKPVPTLREEQKRLTRQKLLDAALAVLTDKGFGETSIDDIVERAGASRGTYYLYFKNKTEIVEELFTKFVGETEQLASRLAELGDGRVITRDELESWIGSFANSFAANRAIIRVWLQAEQANQTRTEGHMDGLIAEVTKLVSGARAQVGRLANAKADRVRALLLLVQLERFCYFWLIRSWKADSKLVTATITDIWLSTIYGDSSH